MDGNMIITETIGLITLVLVDAEGFWQLRHVSIELKNFGMASFSDVAFVQQIIELSFKYQWEVKKMEIVQFFVRQGEMLRRVFAQRITNILIYISIH
jgi:hypothetical protein